MIFIEGKLIKLNKKQVSLNLKHSLSIFGYYAGKLMSFTFGYDDGKILFWIFVFLL